MEKVNVIVGNSAVLETINPATYKDTIFVFEDKIGAFKMATSGNLKGAKYRGQLTGASTDRPTGIVVTGFQYFDTTLNKPIWWNGSAWVDATGATV